MSAWDEWDRLLAEPTPDPLEVIKLAARYQRYLDAVQMKAVPAARASGHTWEEIGAAIGTSRQAVWQRFRGVHEKSVPMTLPPPRFK
jgi:hypothetical protein